MNALFLSLNLSDLPAIRSWEFVGILTGVLSVLLLIPTKHPRLQWTNWVWSVISAAVYYYLFKEWMLYGNMALQVPFVILSILGGIVWLPQLIKRDINLAFIKRIREMPITYTSAYHWTTAFIAAIAMFFVAYPILDHYHDASPLWDGLILTISLSAIYLQIRKYVQSWYLWILVDLIAVPFHLSQDRGGTALLYLAYMMMCFFGLRAWRYAAQELVEEDIQAGYARFNAEKGPFKPHTWLEYPEVPER